MTYIERQNAKIAALEKEVQQKNTLIVEMEIDIQIAIKGIVGTCSDLGINVMDDSMTKLSVGSIISKIAPKLLRGGMTFDKLTELAPLAVKYNHLIN